MTTPSLPDGNPGELGEVVICIPVFNDWPSASVLIDRIDAVASCRNLSLSLLLVDDGSSEPPPKHLSTSPKAIRSVEVLQLRRNLGHQRAIAIGLTFIHVEHPCAMVVVMDGDGEDLPDDIEALMDRCRAGGCEKIVFPPRPPLRGVEIPRGLRGLQDHPPDPHGPKGGSGQLQRDTFSMLERLLASRKCGTIMRRPFSTPACRPTCCRSLAAAGWPANPR